MHTHLQSNRDTLSASFTETQSITHKLGACACTRQLLSNSRLLPAAWHATSAAAAAQPEATHIHHLPSAPCSVGTDHNQGQCHRRQGTLQQKIGRHNTRACVFSKRMCNVHRTSYSVRLMYCTCQTWQSPYCALGQHHHIYPWCHALRSVADWPLLLKVCCQVLLVWVSLLQLHTVLSTLEHPCSIRCVPWQDSPQSLSLVAPENPVVFGKGHSKHSSKASPKEYVPCTQRTQCSASGLGLPKPAWHTAQHHNSMAQQLAPLL